MSQKFSHDSNGTYIEEYKNNKPTTRQLANFRARIVANLRNSDGDVIYFRIRAELAGEVKEFDVAPVDFNEKSWWLNHLGGSASVFARQEPLFLQVVQYFSTNIEEITLLTRTGWWEGPDGVSRFVHAGGVIGPTPHTLANGIVLAPPSFKVQLDEALQLYKLADPFTSQALIDGITTSLSFLAVASKRITVPLFGLIWRSLLGDQGLSVHLYGGSGTRKSSLAAAFLSHLGSGFSIDTLSTNWSSTSNALEYLLHAAKDVPLLIDEFTNNGNHDSLQRTAERVFRSVANKASRQRMTGGGGLKDSLPPAASVISTGENQPGGFSLLARILSIEVTTSDVDLQKLSQLQLITAKQRLPGVTSAFIRWVADNPTAIQNLEHDRESWLLKLKPRFSTHPRTIKIAADLGVGISRFLDFACQAGAIDQTKQNVLRDHAVDALAEACQQHELINCESDPVQRFRELLQSALMSGAGHVRSIKGGKPLNSDAWGWREVGDDDRACGTCIGWVDADNLYLDIEAAYKTAQLAVGKQAEQLQVGPNILIKLLRTGGHLVTTDLKRQTLKVRVTLEGSRREVAHLRTDFLSVITPPTPPPGNVIDPEDAKKFVAELSEHGVATSRNSPERTELCRLPYPGDLAIYEWRNGTTIHYSIETIATDRKPTYTQPKKHGDFSGWVGSADSADTHGVSMRDDGETLDMLTISAIKDNKQLVGLINFDKLEDGVLYWEFPLDDSLI